MKVEESSITGKLTNADIEEAIGQLLVGAEAAPFHELERRTDTFCPFEAIGMVRQEIRHGAFLSYILSPNRPHGLGTAPLRAFLQEIADGADGGDLPFTALDIHFLQLDQARIRKEWRRIDLLIELPPAAGERGTVIAIELKIDAAEGGDQLARYRKIVEREYAGWRRAYVFLTLRDDDPSDAHGKGWMPASLSRMLAAWQDVASRAEGSTGGADLLKAYVAMVRRHMLTDDELEELARKVWSRHGAALDFLMDRKPDVITDIQKSIIDRQVEIARRLGEATGFRIVPEQSTKRIVRFAIGDWDDLEGMRSCMTWLGSHRQIALEFMRYYDDHMRFVYVLGPGEHPVRDAIYEELGARKLDRGKGKAQVGAGHKQLASKYVLSKQDYEAMQDGEMTVDRAVGRIVEKAVAHLKDTLAGYDEAVRAACDGVHPARTSARGGSDVA